MTINTNKTSRQLYPTGDEPAYDVEPITLTTDYVPTDDAGKPIVARGFAILGTTGAVKIDTPAGHTVTIPTGLLAGVVHAIAFTKMYSGTTTATSLMAAT